MRARQDPARLLTLTMIGYLAVNLVVSGLMPPIKGWEEHPAIDIVFTSAWYFLLLRVAGRSERVLQTATAVIGFQTVEWLDSFRHYVERELGGHDQKVAAAGPCRVIHRHAGDDHQDRHEQEEDEQLERRHRDREGAPRGELLRWGLVPYWAKDPKTLGLKLINARSETKYTALMVATQHRDSTAAVRLLNLPGE